MTAEAEETGDGRAQPDDAQIRSSAHADCGDELLDGPFAAAASDAGLARPRLPRAGQNFLRADTAGVRRAAGRGAIDRGSPPGLRPLPEDQLSHADDGRSRRALSRLSPLRG